MAQAAELLDWSVSKVKVRSHRARKKLRQVLAKALPLETGL
jgi:DNA-directed RNA polymerase specialized sigma24 family protein